MSDTLVTPPKKLPKLPPLPRKGNRTIYLADDALWDKAKTLAGKEGISSVISRALLDFVSQRTTEEASYQKFHFEIFDYGGHRHDDTLSPTAVIGFEGRRLLSKTFDLEVSPFDQSGKGVEAVLQIYRTKLGTLVLLADPVADEPDSESAFGHYETFSSVRDLMSGLFVGCMYPPSRHELLTELTTSLGKDAVTWID